MCQREQIKLIAMPSFMGAMLKLDNRGEAGSSASRSTGTRQLVSTAADLQKMSRL